jgi:phosphonate transport system substrate-binding protein
MARRQIAGLIGAAAIVALLPIAASADQFIGGWQKKYPVVKYGIIPVETQTNTMKGMDDFIKHAEKETGVKWELYTATDYSGVMNALIAGQIHLAWLSGFS